MRTIRACTDRPPGLYASIDGMPAPALRHACIWTANLFYWAMHPMTASPQTTAAPSARSVLPAGCNNNCANNNANLRRVIA